MKYHRLLVSLVGMDLPERPVEILGDFKVSVAMC
jgi:hypothetical protein